MTRRALGVAAAVVVLSGCSRSRTLEPFPAPDNAADFFNLQRAFPRRWNPEQPFPIPPEVREARGRFRPLFTLTAPSWTSLGPQPIYDRSTGSSFAGRVVVLAAHPTDINVMYAGADIGGVWKTTNGGNSWTNVTPDLAFPAMRTLVLDPVNPNIVYASTYSTYGTQLLRSPDAGGSWQAVPLKDDAGRAVTVLYKVLIDPRRAGAPDATTLYLQRGGWLYRSDDGGKTLQTILSMPGVIPGNTTGGDEFIQDVALDPRSPDRLFLVSTRDVCPSGCTTPDRAIMIYVSTDAGGHWTKRRVIDVPDIYPVTRVAVGPLASPIVISFRDSQAQKIRAMRSTDLGETWTELPTPIPSSYAWTNALALNPAGDTMYIGNLSLNRSTNGTTWLSVGTPHPDETAIAFDAQGGVLMAGDGGVFRATTAVGPMVAINGGLSIAECYAIAAHPTQPYKLLIGTQDNGSVEFLGAGGWTMVFGGDGGEVLFDPTANPAAAYVETQWANGAYTFRYCTEGGTCEQRISGLDRNLLAPFIPRFAIDSSNPSTVYLTAERLYRTDNKGTLWAPVTPSVKDAQRCWNDPVVGRLCATAGYFSAVAVAPSSSQTVYAGTRNGDVWLSSSGGSTWTSVAGPDAGPLPVRYVRQIAVDPDDAGTAYVVYSGFDASGAGNGHVFRTSDAGRTWTDLSGDLGDLVVNSILVDPDTKPRMLYIGTDFGIMRSDGGGHWEAFNNGLPSVPVQHLIYNKGTQTLLAATYGRGVYAISNRFAR